MSLYMVSLGKFKFSKVIPTKIYRKMLKMFLKIPKNPRTTSKTGALMVTYKIHRLIRRMRDEKDCKVDLSLILVSNLHPVYGPKYLIECFP